MARRIARLLFAGGLIAAVLVGCSSSPENPPPDKRNDPNDISKEERKLKEGDTKPPVQPGK